MFIGIKTMTIMSSFNDFLKDYFQCVTRLSFVPQMIASTNDRNQKKE